MPRQADRTARSGRSRLGNPTPVLSIWLFSAQQQYTGPVAKALPDVGDMTFVVGFLLAFGIYAAPRTALAGPLRYAEVPAPVGQVTST